MFDWNEFYRLAGELAKSTDEASHRSAVSRAYYAAFHGARTYLKGQGKWVPADGTAHREVWSNLLSIPDKNIQHAGAEGDRLRKERIRVDYEANVPNVMNITRPALVKSKAILHYLGQIPEAP